ncbi:Nucleotidylyl transferase [Daldinia vernicosa]|uniref:Nucleotidylyl transferase n=1 Tax=Daldinia vernicosa TaxID=114800 RepID=UPI0020075F32|nr:Nucleotidylyl transferase [Daldinia vernicosa]KAI0851969.1 Nucleotidylyl transferase [Daldinia vernicosa]
MSSTDNSPMARLPSNLVSVFTQALKSYQISNANFRVLCSLTHSSLSSTPTEAPVPHPPQTPPKPLLVLDSSFNPPTLAHQRMALSALSEHGQPSNDSTYKSRVLLLLATNNADKAPKPAAFPQRLAMMYIFAQDLLRSTATETSHKNQCEGVDIAVTTEPYFHAKAAAISASDFYHGHNSSAGERSTTELIFLTGFDTLVRIFNPKYYPDGSMATCLDPFFAHSKLRVTMRPDAEWGDAAAQRAYVRELRAGGLERVGGRTWWAERIEMVEERADGEEEVVSSTKVREAVQRRDWEALKKLVSEDIARWIREEGLYAEGGV